MPAIGGTKSSGRVLGANDPIHVGVAGLHGRGASHISAFQGMENVEVSYLIDPDSSLFGRCAKDVEKPVSHSIHEGRIAVETARKHKRIVQHGTQRRSGGHWKTLRDIAAGKRGKLRVVRGFSF